MSNQWAVRLGAPPWIDCHPSSPSGDRCRQRISRISRELANRIRELANGYFSRLDREIVPNQ
jgi:hypothetical protein